MMRILNDKRVEYSKGKVLELELLLNRIGIVFKPVEDDTPEEESLQAALSAQVRKNEYKGTQGKDRGGPKQSRNPRPDRAESESDPIISCKSSLRRLAAEFVENPLDCLLRVNGLVLGIQ